MKIEIEKSEYDRLKSREEKLMAYYEWFVDKENDLATVEDIVNKNIKLKEENKKLKEDLEKWEDNRMRKLAEIYNMPIKYLTTAITKNEWYSSWYDTVKRKMLHDLGFDRLDVQDLLKENKKLKEEIKERQEEVERFKSNAMADADYELKLEEENKKLKSDLSECECSFGFESDEVGFWEREYKRLKKWIKDHCKGYGNLFPEDEMKRQWKKADKKRK